jgi:sulfite reductase (NADPH) flavoprotein alpha-component
VPSGLVILYATVSGNAEQLAHAAAERLAAAGHPATVRNAADFPVERLSDCDTILCIVATWGEGMPPPDAEEFFRALAIERTLDLSHLRYAVLALGSTMYRDFCAAGRLLDERFAARGARRLLPRRDCDTKFKADFQEWLAQVDVALDTAP